MMGKLGMGFLMGRYKKKRKEEDYWHEEKKNEEGEEGNDVGNLNNFDNSCKWNGVSEF